MTIPDTGLDVTLEIERGRVARVDIRSGRMVQAAALMAGRSPERACFLLPALFSLCGTAQGIAGAMAVETATNCAITTVQHRARRWLVVTEALAETLMTLWRDWPTLAGDKPDLDAAKPFRPLIAASRKALYPSGDWPRPGGGHLLPDKEALGNILAIARQGSLGTLEGFDALTDPRQVEEWAEAGSGPAARLARRILVEDWDTATPSITLPMPRNGPPDLDTRLADDLDGHYLSAPDWQGGALDASALARHGGHALVAGLKGGLLARLAARLLDLAAALREAEDLVQDLTEDTGVDVLPATSGTGLARVEAARGLLVHRVELEEGVIRRYQILAPTEWTFHPEGALVSGLLDSQADEGLAHRARVLAALLDPCVELRLKVVSHA